jgi:transcriptional regulator with XRE-family HTH domain
MSNISARRSPGDPIPSEFVREYRIRNNLTQDELAHRMGVAGKAVVSGWETGRTKCEGPAAEFLLHLLGRGNAAVEIPALTRDMDATWGRTKNVITAWRQIAAVPESTVEIGLPRFARLFPEAALPTDQVQHGFPFTGENLPGNVCGVGPSGWLGCIPSSQEQQPRYLWTFKRDGRFAYREALWEEHPSSRTRGHFDLGTIAVVSLQTSFFLVRLAQLLALPDDLGFTIQLDLQGARGKGIADGSDAVDDSLHRTNTWAENRAEASISTTIRDLKADAYAVGVGLVSELVVQVSVDLAERTVVDQIIRPRINASGQLGFLKDRAF